MYSYSEEEFKKCYNEVINSLSLERVYQKNHCVIFLGGQPGSGKSSFINQDDFFVRHVKINGDDYRKFHPHFESIVSEHNEDMANLTQPFVNECVERLINDLSDQGYNIIIEGTLRNPDITIGTCKLLKSKGYTTDMYIMATDALTSWNSTLYRAQLAESLGEVPRFVPIEKYNYIVMHLIDNVRIIQTSDCFDSINVVNRENNILYSSNNICNEKAADIVEKELHLDDWKKYYADNQNISRKITCSDEVYIRRKGR